MAAQAGLIETEDIIIDAKSGVSGAGRSAKQNLLYTEIAEGINCYGVGSHRHMPEIEQVSLSSVGPIHIFIPFQLQSGWRFKCIMACRRHP